SSCLVTPFFFSSRRRHTRSYGDWSSDVCSSDLYPQKGAPFNGEPGKGPASSMNPDARADAGWTSPGARRYNEVAFFTCLTFSRRDRKSTRLNSSHRTISYAVFCLKKKKKHISGL